MSDKSQAPAIPTSVPFTQLVINVPNPKAAPPARPGTARAKRWAVLAKMGGNTVAEYYAKLREMGNPCAKNNPTLAHAKGFIVLTAPKK